MRRIALWLGIGAALCLSAAPAAGYTYREQRALQVARAAWGRLPCGGRITIARHALAGPVEDGDAAEADLPCTIVYDPAALARARWTFYCTIIVHEVGHLLGYGHSSDPANVMYPSPTHTYWRCNHSPDWRPPAPASR